MEILREQISEKLNKIKKMIEQGDDKDKIEKEKKQLDKLLEEYVKEI